MTEYLFTFLSLTRAQSGQRALQGRGIAADLRRTPKEMAARGCGYSLAIPEADLWPAVEILREHQIACQAVYRVLEGGTLEEVVL